MREVHLYISFIFLFIGLLIYTHQPILPDDPPTHTHKPIATLCIGNGTKCNDLIWCEDTGKRVIFGNKHVTLTTQDSVKWKLE